MNRKVIVSVLGAVVLAVGTALALSVASSPPSPSCVNVVGYFNIVITGGCRQMISLPMTKIPAMRGGAILANDAATIGVSEILVPNLYNRGVRGVENAGASCFYLEITQPDSPFRGRHMYIAANTATNLTVKDGLPSDIRTNDLASCSFRIVPALRVRDVFGEPWAPLLASGTSSSDTNADLVMLWNPRASAGNGAWDAPIYHQKGRGSSVLNGHWVQSGRIADDRPFDRDEAMLVTRRANSNVNLTVAGEVNDNAQAVVAGREQRIFGGGMTVVDVPIRDSGLTNALGFHSGSAVSDTNATIVTKWDKALAGGSGGWDVPVYFQAGGNQTALNGHWVRNGVNVDTNCILKAGEGYLIKNPSGLQWIRASPLR